MGSFAASPAATALSARRGAAPHARGLSAKSAISSTAGLNRRIAGLRAAATPPTRMGMGIGFVEEGDLPKKIIRPRQRKLESPANMYGLSTEQMGVLGLTGDHTDYRKAGEPEPEMLTAKAHYGQNYQAQMTSPTMMSAVGTQMSYGGPPGQAPPDLPSLLLHSRICYLGMPLVPAVTELIIAELLWLNYDSPQKPLYLYINSTGSQTRYGEAVGFETEAYAIMDTLNYVRPDVHTVCIGQAYGNAAMLLASGTKGFRYSLPNASIMTCPPRINRASGGTKSIMGKANELEDNTQTYVDFLTQFTGKKKEDVRKDVGRTRYFTPNEAIEYGLIDKVIKSGESAIDAKDYEGMIAQQAAADRAAAAAPGGG